MLFEKIVTTQPLISYDNATQICVIGGVMIFIVIIASIVVEFNGGSVRALILGMLIVFVVGMGIQYKKIILRMNKFHYQK